MLGGGGFSRGRRFGRNRTVHREKWCWVLAVPREERASGVTPRTPNTTTPQHPKPGEQPPYNAARVSKGSAGERIAFVVICFGYLILASTLAVVSGERSFAYTNDAVVSMIVLELGIGAATILFLRYRGWTAADFGFRVSLKSTLAAIALFAATYGLCLVAYMLAAPTGMFRGWTDIAVKMTATPGLVVLFLMVNSVFEELFVVGYLIEATPVAEVSFAVSTSALVRLLYHTYQGPVAFVYILPLGLVFALVYIRWRNLWTLMVAHTLFNVVGWLMSA